MTKPLLPKTSPSIPQIRLESAQYALIDELAHELFHKILPQEKTPKEKEVIIKAIREAVEKLNQLERKDEKDVIERVESKKVASAIIPIRKAVSKNLLSTLGELYKDTIPRELPALQYLGDLALNKGWLSEELSNDPEAIKSLDALLKKHGLDEIPENDLKRLERLFNRAKEHQESTLDNGGIECICLQSDRMSRPSSADFRKRKEREASSQTKAK